MRLYKFNALDGDCDYRTFQKKISGRITKMRWKLLDSYARRLSFSGGNCGHEWDCCGCLCGRKVYMDYKYNQLIITITEQYNY
jgi:hypothetical protein